LGSVFTKLHFRIGPKTILVLPQGGPPHFTTKLRPCANAMDDEDSDRLHQQELDFSQPWK